jgi:hypothetical protein
MSLDEQLKEGARRLRTCDPSEAELSVAWRQLVQIADDRNRARRRWQWTVLPAVAVALIGVVVAAAVFAVLPSQQAEPTAAAEQQYYQPLAELTPREFDTLGLAGPGCQMMRPWSGPGTKAYPDRVLAGAEYQQFSFCRQGLFWVDFWLFDNAKDQETAWHLMHSGRWGAYPDGRVSRMQMPGLIMVTEGHDDTSLSQIRDRILAYTDEP